MDFGAELIPYRVTDPERAVTEVEDPDQALYRQAQLALREVVGTRALIEWWAKQDSNL